MAGKISLDGIRRAFSHRDYAIYSASNFASMTGEWMQRVGIGWLTWELTHSTLWLGIIAVADMIPAMLLSPFAGTYTDRIDRLKFLRVVIALSALQPLLVMALYFAGMLDIWWVLALSIYNGLIGAFNQAARLAIVPYLVERRDIPPAVALGSVIYNLSRFSGPALAGTAIATIGVGSTFVANFLTYSAQLVALYCIKLKYDEPLAKRGGTMLADTWEGMRYALRHPGIGPLMFLLIGGSLGQRPVVELLPGFAAVVFDRGPEALGWMVSMIGLGALTGATYLALRPSLKGQSRLAVHAVLLNAVMLIGFSLSGNYWLALACLCVAGMGLSMSAVGVMSLIQSSVDSTMRGRELSLYGLIFRGGPAIGAFLMGYAAEFVGLGLPVAVGAGVCILLWAVISRRLPQIAGVMEPDMTKPRPAPVAAKAGE